MLTDAQISSILNKLADTFLRDQRATGPAPCGWGQFVGQTTSTQIGLYGTCAGIITVSAAYGHTRVPDCVVPYLTELWQQRSAAGTQGARYFALTARCAFLFMALRQSRHPALARIMAELDRELRNRILNDGLFVGWRVDANNQSVTGDEYSSALAVLAYGITALDSNDIPPEIRRAAETLQVRVEGSPPRNVGVQKFYLAAITIALDRNRISRKTLRLVRINKAGERSRDQDSLYFWDYSYLGPTGLTSRRDYFFVPSVVVDILLASTSVAGRFQKLAALDVAGADATPIISSGLYFGGRELAASNNQAWMSLALLRTRFLISVDTVPNRLVRRAFAGAPQNAIGSFVLPLVVLFLSGLAAAAPDRLFEFAHWAGLMASAKPGGPEGALIQAIGLIALTVWGTTLANRAVMYVRSFLP
jgi:hypothetical protein